MFSAYGLVTLVLFASFGSPSVVLSLAWRGPWGFHPVSFVFDGASVSFLCILRLVACTCHRYSNAYLPGPPRATYHLFYFLFYLSIRGLIVSGDLLTLLLFWDGLGITSFLLVRLHVTTHGRSGGLLALCRNRVGDVLLIVGLAGSWGSALWALPQAGGVSCFLARAGLLVKRGQ